MHKNGYTALIGTNTMRDSLGIYTVFIDGDTLQGEIKYTERAYNTGALALSSDGKSLYAASEGMSFMGYASGGVMAYTVEDDGKLTYRNGVPVWGQRPCSLALDEKKQMLYSANFFGGNLSMIPLKEDGSVDAVKEIITAPKPEHWLHAMHWVEALEDGAFLAAINVAQSELSIYDAETGERVTGYCFGERIFARAVVSYGPYIYAMLQDPGEIYVFRNTLKENRKIELIQRILVLEGFDGRCAASVIRVSPDGKIVLAASREQNKLTVFRRSEDGTLSYANQYDLPGDTARDFMISEDGRIVVIAMQFSDTILIYEINEETAELTLKQSALKICSPAAVVIRKEEHA